MSDKFARYWPSHISHVISVTFALFKSPNTLCPACTLFFTHLLAVGYKKTAHKIEFFTITAETSCTSPKLLFKADLITQIYRGDF